MYVSKLKWKDGSTTTGDVAVEVASPTGARFAVMRAVRPTDAPSALAEVLLERVGPPSEALSMRHSWGHAGSGPIDVPLVDLSDDLLVMPLDSLATPHAVAASPESTPWLGKRVWVPAISDAKVRRVEGVVVARPFGAIVVDVEDPSTVALDGNPVISMDGQLLVGIVSRSAPRAEGGQRLQLVPSGAVWQRVSAEELRYPLESVICGPDTGALARAFYGWRTDTPVQVRARRVRETGGALTSVRGAWSLVASATPQGGFSLQVQEAQLEERPEAENDPSSGTIRPLRPLQIEVTGRLTDPDAARREAWWSTAATAAAESDLDFAFTPAWQWRAHVELLQGLELLAGHQALPLPTSRKPSASDELLHARVTHRVACYPESTTHDCARVVMYLRRRASAPGREAPSTPAQSATLGSWLLANAPRGALVREVLVTQLHSLRPVSIRSEVFLRKGQGELDIAHALLEEHHEPPMNDCCKAPAQMTKDRSIAAEVGSVLYEQPKPSADNQSPEYPTAARRAGLESFSKVAIWIAKEGRVSKACVMTGHEWFDEAILQALKTWRYTPANANGEPIEVVRVIHIPFMLE